MKKTDKEISEDILRGLGDRKELKKGEFVFCEDTHKWYLYELGNLKLPSRYNPKERRFWELNKQ